MHTRLASRWLLLVLTAFAMSFARAEKLTIERLFNAPDLSGASLRAPQISPDGRLVTYLKGAEHNKDRLDLWAYDIAKRHHLLLVDASKLVPQERALSGEPPAGAACAGATDAIRYRAGWAPFSSCSSSRGRASRSAGVEEL